jgi:acetylornithine deacetylase/succinyl-diaminopimelate desuccinylase-like protein
MDRARVAAHVDESWDRDVVKALHDYIRIPNVSVAYDPDWATSGHMDRAVDLLRDWCLGQCERELPDAIVDVCEMPGRTPVLLVDIPAHGPSAGTGADDHANAQASGSSDEPEPEPVDTVLLYGHLDKQPPFEGWRDGLGPWEPVLEGDRLYGRGAADDGYAVFAALTAIAGIRAAGGSHRRCLVLIEASEESGSPDLPAHLDALAATGKLGRPSLVVVLDSSCGDYEHMWAITSIRGLVDLALRVEVLTEGVHSGLAGGIVPSTFRVLRQLLDRIEDPVTGELTVPELHVEVPEVRRRQITETAAELGDPSRNYPFVDGAGPTTRDPERQLLAQNWGPALEVTGLSGAPPVETAGNVLRPATTAKLSIRVPPTADAQSAAAAVVQRLMADRPHGMRVTVTPGAAESGWHAPPEAPWLAEALQVAAQEAFGGPPRSIGEGGTIPFLDMLGRRFPEAQFLVTGVLGPESNAHGPNEFLHVPTARRVTTAVAHVVDAHARRAP